MTLAAIFAGLVLLVAPGVVSRAPRGCSIGQWARASRTSLTAGLALVVVGLVLWGAPVIFHLLDGTGLPGFCDDAVHALPLGGLTWALVVLGVAAVVTMRIVTGVARAITGLRCARVDPFVGRHRRLGEYDVVVVPSAQLVAVAVPGNAPQIVLSEGLVSTLEAVEVDAVIRHEMAHHRLRHRQYLILAAVVDHVVGWIPPVRTSTAALRTALEAWADEASTARSPVRTARLRSALTRLRSAHDTTPVHDAIERRLARLDHTAGVEPGEGRARSGFLCSAVTAAGVVATLAIVLATGAQLVSTLGRCTA